MHLDYRRFVRQVGNLYERVRPVQPSARFVLGLTLNEPAYTDTPQAIAGRSK